MESSSGKNLEIAKTWLRCFNEHNLENLLALYDEQAIHFSPKLKVHRPETNGLIKGKASLRDWWKDAFQRLPELQYREVSLTADEQRVFMEYTRIVPGEPEMNVAEVLEIENGLIIRSRVYHG
jgi:limonene-1,2-epoxide hydrolase